MVHPLLFEKYLKTLALRSIVQYLGAMAPRRWLGDRDQLRPNGEIAKNERKS